MKILIRKGSMAYFLMQLCLVFVLLGLSREAHAENYYAFNIYRLQAGSGNIYEMGAVTKCTDLNTCELIAKQKATPIGKWECIEYECVHGVENDELFKYAFENKPTSELYISFTDLNGYETRINFMGLPIAASAPLASAIVNSIKMQGITNARIIYPKE